MIENFGIESVGKLISIPFFCPIEPLLNFNALFVVRWPYNSIY